MTRYYAENIRTLSLLQADSRRDNGEHTALIDQACDKARELGFIDGDIQDLQGYYAKTIDQGTAFHGIGLKLFTGKLYGMQLAILDSSDCQYPLEYWIVSNDCLVARIASFKHTKTLASKLTEFDLMEALISTIEQMNNLLSQGIKLNLQPYTLGNFRKYRKLALR